MTGISEHTLRVWERRYGFPLPSRTSGGARRYSDEDVSLLKLVTRALKIGYRAGDVVGMSRAELSQLVLQHQSVRPAPTESSSVEAAIALMRKDDAKGVRQELRQALAALGPGRFVTDFAAPLAEKMGESWSGGELSIQQEHLTTHALSCHLRTMLTAFETSGSRPRMLLTTLPDEPHGLGVDLVALYAASRGASVFPLGISTPIDQIVDAAKQLTIDVVGISVTESYDAERANTLLHELHTGLPPRTELWLGGAGIAKHDHWPKGAHKMRDWADIDAAIARFS
jgi:MerR family transcriptional regulator, light-induced transcriptional regulator